MSEPWASADFWRGLWEGLAVARVAPPPPQGPKFALTDGLRAAADVVAAGHREHCRLMGYQIEPPAIPAAAKGGDDA
jgi:hypothetical protein